METYSFSCKRNLSLSSHESILISHTFIESAKVAASTRIYTNVVSKKTRNWILKKHKSGHKHEHDAYDCQLKPTHPFNRVRDFFSRRPSLSVSHWFISFRVALSAACLRGNMFGRQMPRSECVESIPCWNWWWITMLLNYAELVAKPGKRR